MGRKTISSFDGITSRFSFLLFGPMAFLLDSLCHDLLDHSTVKPRDKDFTAYKVSLVQFATVGVRIVGGIDMNDYSRRLGGGRKRQVDGRRKEYTRELRSKSKLACSAEMSGQ